MPPDDGRASLDFLIIGLSGTAPKIRSDKAYSATLPERSRTVNPKYFFWKDFPKIQRGFSDIVAPMEQVKKRPRSIAGRGPDLQRYITAPDVTRSPYALGVALVLAFGLLISLIVSCVIGLLGLRCGFLRLCGGLLRLCLFFGTLLGL